VWCVLDQAGLVESLESRYLVSWLVKLVLNPCLRYSDFLCIVFDFNIHVAVSYCIICLVYNIRDWWDTLLSLLFGDGVSVGVHVSTLGIEVLIIGLVTVIGTSFREHLCGNFFESSLVVSQLFELVEALGVVVHLSHSTSSGRSFLGK
jgi:hypothetical protein